MASVNAVEVTRDMLAYTLTNDKQSLVKLLKRNGIDIPSDASDKDVTMAVLLASGKSAVFKSELANLLSSKIDEVNAGFQNFAGGQFDIGTQEDKTMFTGSEDFFPMTGLSNPAFSAGLQGAAQKIKEQKSVADTKPAKQPKEKGKVWAWLGENIFTKENINAGLNMGLTALNNKIQTNANRVNYESEAIINRQQEQIEQKKKKSGIGVGSVVLIIVGVGLLGAMVYYFTKK